MIRIRCKDHPDHNGMKVPTNLCNACWYVFHVAMFVYQSDDERLEVDQGKGFNG